jgi:hypothetical protein
MALARGAALASAHAPLFVSSTAARAYAQDPGTGAVLPYAVAPEYFDVPAGAQAGDALAYSAVPDELADAYTGEHTAGTRIAGADYGERRSFTLIGSAVAAIFIVGVAALVVSLAISIRPTAGVRPDPGQNIVAPAQQPVAVAPAPAPVAPAQAPAAVPAPAPVPVPQAPVQIPQAPAAVPIPVPAAPAPVPVPVPVAPAPAPVPIPIPLPGIFGGPPGGGEHGGPGFPGFPGGGGHGGGGHGGFGGPGFGGGFGGGHFGGGHR